MTRAVVLASSEVADAVRLARDWCADGATVTLVLLDGAAAHARDGHPGAPELSALVGEGVAVAAHDGALRRRGIRPGGIADGVRLTDLDEVADLLADGADRAVWL